MSSTCAPAGKIIFLVCARARNKRIEIVGSMHLCYFFMSSWCLEAVARALLLYCKAAAASLYSAHCVLSSAAQRHPQLLLLDGALFYIGCVVASLFLCAMYFHVLRCSLSHAHREWGRERERKRDTSKIISLSLSLTRSLAIFLLLSLFAIFHYSGASLSAVCRQEKYDTFCDCFFETSWQIHRMRTLFAIHRRCRNIALWHLMHITTHGLENNFHFEMKILK